MVWQWSRHGNESNQGPWDCDDHILFIALAETLDTITVLGAFLAGVVVSMVVGRDREILQDKLDALALDILSPSFCHGRQQFKPAPGL